MFLDSLGTAPPAADQILRGYSFGLTHVLDEFKNDLVK